MGHFEITFSYVRIDDRGNLPQWSLTSVCFPEWLCEKEFYKALFPFHYKTAFL